MASPAKSLIQRVQYWCHRQLYMDDDFISAYPWFDRSPDQMLMDDDIIHAYPLFDRSHDQRLMDHPFSFSDDGFLDPEFLGASNSSNIETSTSANRRMLPSDSQYGYAERSLMRWSLAAQLRAFRSEARESNTSQFAPASHRHLTYLQTVCLGNSRDNHTYEVHDQNSTRVEEQPLHWVWVRSTHPGSHSQLHPGSHTMLSEIQHPTGVEEQPHFNRPRLPETFLGITSQAALTMLTIWTSGSTGFSQNAKILFCSAAACNVIGFLFCLFSMLLSGRKTGVASRIVTGTGFVFTAYGFLAIMGMLLSDNIMLWVTGLACIAFLPALASPFM